MKKAIMLSVVFTFLLSGNVQAAEETFNDVHSEHVNKEAIEYLENNHVIQGYSDGSYKPENRINRAEFVKILIQSQIQNPSGSFCFDDVRDEWFAPYICTAKRLGYIKGYDDNTFKPSQYINFAEASKMIANVLKIKADTKGTKGEWYAGFVNSLAQKKAIPTTIQHFGQEVTRGEMAEIIWRITEENTTKVSQDYPTLTSTFPALNSCEALRDQFETYRRYRPYGRDVMMLEKAEFDSAASVKNAKNTDQASDFSTTNIQVKGVDEADIIKNDGRYIYLIKNQTVRIIQAYPASEMKEVGKITFTEGEFSPNEMFLNGDQLVIIGSSWKPYTQNTKSLILPRRPSHTRTQVYVLDITNRSQPKEERVLSFEGYYHTSRRIENRMVLIMNQYPDFWILENIRKGEDLLPRFSNGEGGDQPMVSCEDIRYFPGYSAPNYLIVASIDLEDESREIKREVFLGASENIYSSLENLYIASNEINHEHYTDWDWRQDNAHTLIFKFNLEKDGGVTYQSRGRVPGRILNQFSMDEHQKTFRLATTIESWIEDKPSTNQIYVLDDEMNIRGKIENIAPGERIYSTRFIGDRLYMVTFRRVDPLFVVDLKDPGQPKILGQLKIPGFSDYLHPFDENHIIGFGKETEETKNGAVLTKGFKMALFDVSNVSKPQQKFVEIIGDRGTDSELLRNHKALLFDKEKELLAFPINIVEKVELQNLKCSQYRYSDCPGLCQKRCIPSSCTEDADGAAVCTDDCDGLGSCQLPDYERYNTTFSGAVIYQLNAEKGFNQKGKITHYDENDLIKMGDYWPYNDKRNIQRILYMDQALYTVSQSKIKANDRQTIETVNEIKLD